jgi:hypothetical protein
MNVTDSPAVAAGVETLTLVDDAGVPIVTVCAADALGLKAEFPWYSATRGCEPVESDDVVNLAIPPERISMSIVVVPSTNATVPVGVPPFEATVAVNVTG